MTPRSELIDTAAEAAAILDEYDGCFQRVREWEALEEWEREASPGEHPYADYEDCEWWRKRITAALLAVGLIPEPTS